MYNWVEISSVKIKLSIDSKTFYCQIFMYLYASPFTLNDILTCPINYRNKRSQEKVEVSDNI